MDLKNYSASGYDRGAAVWKEALWFAVKCVFFLNPFPWPSSWRVRLLRLFGARIGRRAVIRGNVNITFPWRLTVGDDVWIGEEVTILSLALVTIESDVCISQRSFLCTGSHDFRAPQFDLVTKPITIHRESWIAAQAFIAPGVEVGPHSMVCAGSIVLETVLPNTRVRGNPAVSLIETTHAHPLS
ncbi:MAG: WcaF family extracellular polysaccharide biosynthesis acetyltransferase [Verrucomicrobiota bacterium]